jgi:hypothetical protein
LLCPIPTLLFFNTKSPLPYCPITTLSSAKTSITGSPALLLTDIKLSLRSSTTENNVPFVPSVRSKVAPAEVEFICNCPEGTVVPMPTFPLLAIRILSAALVVIDMNPAPPLLK